MGDKVLYLRDYERRSREPDAGIDERDPAGATVIILPIVRTESPPPDWSPPTGFTLVPIPRPTISVTGWPRPESFA